MKPIISVEGLGKKYVIRHEGQTHYKSLREEIFQLPKKLLRREENKEEFWALKDVSFDIMPGDRVGIIGRNGAGKSTLLKLLSRITVPTTGRITLRGRVASLLEVGTGFHPELTGRENIYLNGAILGMSRAEVRHKFDEIVDFSGVEKFLDTPVKRYSSGMYVRLAFAVAAHLEPDIFIVDEVLAVGDAEFQKKCLGKMEEVSAGDGRAVLFVSHNLAAVQFLCNKGIWVKDASIEGKGDIDTIIEQYTRRFCAYSKNATTVFSSEADSGGQFSKVFKEITLMNSAAQPVTSFALNEDIFVKLKLNKDLAPCDADLGVSIYKGVERISSICTWMTGDTKPIKKMSSSEIMLSIKAPRLSPGLYNLTLSAADHQAGTVYEIIESALSFTIENLKGYQSTSEFHSGYGVICVDGSWTY